MTLLNLHAWKSADDRNEDPNCRTYCWDVQSIKEVNLASKPCSWRLWPLKMDQWTTTQNFDWVHFDGVDLHNARRYAFNFNLHVNSWPTKMVLSLLETAIDNMWILASEEQGWRVIAFRLAPEDRSDLNFSPFESRQFFLSFPLFPVPLALFVGPEKSFLGECNV